MAFQGLAIIVFFFLGGSLLALPWHAVVLGSKRLLGDRPQDGWYAALLVVPVAMIAVFVLAILGPWDSRVCQALHQTCLDGVSEWRVPFQLGMALILAAVIAGGRLIRPYLQSLGNPWRPEGMPLALGEKWAKAVQEVARHCERPVPEVSVVAGPDHTCLLVWLGRFRLVISPALVQQLDHDELVAALTHEMAHLSRGDLIIGTMAYVGYSFLFFMPLGRHCYQRYLEERELAADAWAIARSANPLALASALIKTGRMASSRPSRRPLGGEIFKRRLIRLTHAEEATARPRPWSAARIALVGLAGTVSAVCMMSQHLTLEGWGWNLLAMLRIIA